MSTRLDAMQLDRTWDALVLGESPAPPMDDVDAMLFALLEELDRMTPSSAFVRSLEQELDLGSTPVPMRAASSRVSVEKTQPAVSPGTSWRRPPSNWMHMGYALAALALIVLLSGIAIARQRSGVDEGPTIPAVSDWTSEVPATTPGVTAQTIFSHVFSADQLAEFDLDQWGWMVLDRVSAPPGAVSHPSDGTDGVATSAGPGMALVAVETGALTFQLSNPVYVSRAGASELTRAETGAEITLGPGDAMIYAQNTLAAAWNPSSETTRYLAGGLFARPGTPLFFPTDNSDIDTHGISISSDALQSESSLDLTLSRVIIGPGEVYAYRIDEQTPLLAKIGSDGLIQQRWSGRNPDGSPKSLLASSYALHQDGAGYYTLTNSTSEPIAIDLFQVAPPATETAAPQEAAASPVATTLVSQTLDADQLESYQSDHWSWISISQGIMPPGSQAIIEVGSPQVGDVGFTGLGLIDVTSGTLTANAAAGAVVKRGDTGAIEPVDRTADVTLEAGDSLIAPANTLPAIWNKSASDATYLTGGVYTTSNITPLNEVDIARSRGGIRVDPNDLNVGEPVTFSMQQVSIPPGTTFAYSVSSETWLEAIVNGGELAQQKRIDGVDQGSPETLVPSVYSLHMDGFGDYTLTNDGDQTVDVSFFRVEAQHAAGNAATPEPSITTLVHQTLSVDSLASFRASDWTWIDFERNRIAPQADSADFASLGKIPGRNEPPGVSLLSVEFGTLVIVPEADVLVGKGVDSPLESVTAGTELTLGAGDVMIYHTGTGGKFWNPTDTATVLVGGGGYLRPSAPTFAVANTSLSAGGPGAGQFGSGVAIDRGGISERLPLGITIERITITPGNVTDLDTNASQRVIAVVEEGDLEQTTTIAGGTPSAPTVVRQGEITLRADEAQHVSLRNVGMDDAVIYVMLIESS